MVRVHQEEYDSLPGLSVTDEGTLLAALAPGLPPLTLSLCLQVGNFPVEGSTFTVFWSEWQRAVGGGWVVAQDNNKIPRSAQPGATGGLGLPHQRQ